MDGAHGRVAIMRASFALLLVGACAPTNHMMNTPLDGATSDATKPVDGASADAAEITGALSGINFPPTQGNSNAGAFLPGVYTWSYTDPQIAAANATFQIMRLPINVDTANDPAALAQLKGFVDQFAGQRAIICMFGTASSGTGTHGTGKVDDVAATTAAWAKIHAVFGSYPNVHYEIFNEPFGYPRTDPAGYVHTMTQIIAGAGLPPDRCILDGMGYADDIQSVASAGWTGDVGYHFYPNWSSDHTQSAYSNLVQAKIGSLGSRTWITEFGANLGYTSNQCYETYEDGAQPSSADINALRGLDDAVRALRASGRRVKGVVSWHGWNNGDGYDYWNAANAQGACKIRLIQSHA
jgi:hypothetical protein